MKEYRVVCWDNADGKDYANYIHATETTYQGEADAEGKLGWDHVIVESREVSDWEEI